MLKIRCITTMFVLLFMLSFTVKATQFKLEEKFDNPQTQFRKVGRGVVEVKNGVLVTKDAYACFGKPEWSNYEIRFSARTPKSADQVQIWAGFRAYNRNDRYIFGLEGGQQDDLYLSRMGYMGTDEFLGLRDLDFHPEIGKWYNFRIVVSEDRTQIFINDETLPRIDVVDKNKKLAPSGEVILGGGWLETEYDNLTITSLPDEYLFDIKTQEYIIKATPQEKESKRVVERQAYKTIKIDNLSDSRTEISLDGQWLFMPTYELNNADVAVSPSSDDNKWHVMTVPSFWNPIRIWLHGEVFAKHPKGASDTYYQQETDRCENYTFDYKKTKAAWYRQWVELPESVKSKNLELVFDAVSKVAEVYINGTKAGSNIGMFGELRIDASKLFKPGKNLIAVKVTRDYINNIEDGDKIVDVAVTVPVTNKMLKDIAHGFYGDDPAGIWQPVNLIITNPIKINDVFIKPTLTGASFEITVKNNSNQKASFSVKTDIVDKNTFQSLYNNEILKNIQLNAGEEKVLTYSVNDLKPKLWSPQTPNLYDFSFTLVDKKKELDKSVITSGFRTFETKNGLFYLNGNAYWLRGANHTPFALAPNDKKLADTFFQLMRAGNMEVTRTHTCPYNKLWMDAADRNGVAISFEGTWPWLMINGSMPNKELIDMWADEFISLLKKYRNHPSLIFWTINNEMKFYDNDPDFERAKVKMKIVSDVVKRMRVVDGTRPICFDSNYKRKESKFGKEFFNTIDDGDIDDIHSYVNWYNYSVFQQFNGEFQKNNKNEGRPLISQEMSTGYPNNETGHPTRFYTIIHQNPQVLVGDQAYAYGNPAAFLEIQAFITGELGEALRRSNDQASGILHFALLTWFRNVYNSEKIEPYPTYYAMKRAMQPVLVTAEIWGRNFYAGDKLPIRVCVVNDNSEGKVLQPTSLKWKLVDDKGKSMAEGTEVFPVVAHYGREWITPSITVPAKLSSQKTVGKLLLELTENGKLISTNEYKLIFAEKVWTQTSAANNKKIVLVDFNNMKSAIDHMGIKYTQAENISNAMKMPADLYILSGLDQDKNVSLQDISAIKNYVAKGGKVLLLSSEKAAQLIYPDLIKGVIVPTEGDIANMETPESNVFDGIDLLELRYFNNTKREIPKVCNVSFKVNRNPKLELLASQTKIHGYINGEMDKRSEYVESIKGFPLLKINDNGSVIVSAMAVEKSITDPIAGRLLINMVNSLLK